MTKSSFGNGSKGQEFLSVIASHIGCLCSDRCYSIIASQSPGLTHPFQECTCHAMTAVDDTVMPHIMLQEASQ